MSTNVNDRAFFIHDRKTQKRPFFGVRLVSVLCMVLAWFWHGFDMVLIGAREQLSLGSLSLQSGSRMVLHIGRNIRFS